MNDALESIKNLGAKKLAILGAAGLTILVTLILLALTVSSGSLSPLYSNLSLEDSQKIISELESRGINYDIAGNGTQILIHSESVLRMRMHFAEQGIPSSQGATIGYEIFDRDEKLGTSSFVQNVNQLRALEGELSRTIVSMTQVRNARVHLVVPKRELFRKDRVDPTASIQLTMNGSERLSSGEVAAIRYLVATAVPGLTVDAITVVDSRGILLARGGEDPDSAATYASSSQEYRMNYEKQVKNSIQDLLERYVGMGNVKAQVSAEIDFDRTVTKSKVYDPEGQVVVSAQSSEEIESSSAGGGGADVSVANNLPGGGAGATDGGGGEAEKREVISEVTNYENSWSEKDHVSETGTVKKLSIAVLVDGLYETDEETGEVQYADRTPEEIEKLTALVKSAVGFNAERGDTIELTSLPFSPDFGGYKASSMFDVVQQNLQSVVQILVMGLVAIMVLLMVVRPLVKRALEMNVVAAPLPGETADAPLLAPPGGVGGGAPQLAAGGAEGAAGAGQIAGIEGMEDQEDEFSALAGLQNKSKPSSVKKLNEMIEQNPEDTVAAIRTWMYGEGA